MYILGIETSCDDTSVCLLKIENGKNTIIDVLTSSMLDSLAPFGGIVPEIVSRNHVKKISVLIEQILKDNQLLTQDIDYIGVTTLPGLLGALLTGLNAAKTLSLMYKIPIIPVNHLYAHITAVHLTHEIEFPYVSLLVSGGHTMLFWVTDPQNFEILGSTNDDAAGEAFDKGGKMLGLGYPAGHLIDKLAKKCPAHADLKKTQSNNQNKNPLNEFKFPIGLIHQDNCNFSFSGVKTSLRYQIEKNSQLIKMVEDNKKIKNKNLLLDKDNPLLFDICYRYQEAIVGALINKTQKAINLVSNKYSINKNEINVVIGGGVACNSFLRSSVKKLKSKEVYFSDPKYCTDNAGMIAHQAALNLEQKINFPECLDITVTSRFINKKDYR